MRVLVVCQHYWPESFQITAVCEDLARRGHEVTVVAGLPNYPSGHIPDGYRHGRNRIQEKDGVKILRAFEVGRKPGPAGLAANYYSYAKAAEGVVDKLDSNYDVVFAYQLSPVLMAQPAVRYKQRYGAPMLLYCCDLWPESMKALLGDRCELLQNHYRKISKRIYDEADILAVQSVAFLDYFDEVHEIERGRMRYIPQFGPDSYLNEDMIDAGHEGVNFLFAGNIGRAQDIPCIIDAVSKMKVTTGFAVHFVGDGAVLERIRADVVQRSLADRVVFHGKVPFPEMPQWYRMTDFCLLTLDGSSWVGTTLPSKLQGYMSAGKPIIAAIDGGARKVIEDSGCGLVVSAGDAQGLAGLMDECVVAPEHYRGCGQAGREFFKRHFMRSQHVDAIEEALIEIYGRKLHG